jgi:hypothetical protein
VPRLVFRAVLRLFVEAAGFAALFRAAGLAALFRAAGFFAAERVVFGRAELRLELDDWVESASSSDHLPDITFWAASATASAISEPRRVALAVIDFAARSAVSAASKPASLIALRAFGLALIAAAAAARPAASISLLIAAFLILSIVSLDFDELLLEEPLRVLDFAIASLL